MGGAWESPTCSFFPSLQHQWPQTTFPKPGFLLPARPTFTYPPNVPIAYHILQRLPINLQTNPNLLRCAASLPHLPHLIWYHSQLLTSHWNPQSCHRLVTQPPGQCCFSHFPAFAHAWFLCQECLPTSSLSWKTSIFIRTLLGHYFLQEASSEPHITPRVRCPLSNSPQRTNHTESWPSYSRMSLTPLCCEFLEDKGCAVHLCITST